MRRSLRIALWIGESSVANVVNSSDLVTKSVCRWSGSKTSRLDVSLDGGRRGLPDKAAATRRPQTPSRFAIRVRTTRIRVVKNCQFWSGGQQVGQLVAAVGIEGLAQVLVESLSASDLENLSQLLRKSGGHRLAHLLGRNSVDCRM